MWTEKLIVVRLFNLAQITTNKNIKIKQTNASAHFGSKSKIRESSPKGIRKTVEETICERDKF